MHASSLENMWACYRRYVAGGPLECQRETVVLDVGSADVNGSYREVFARSPFRYIGVDTGPGPGVDLVLTDPYRLPLEDGSIDIVVSGQALEHSEFFWRVFAEMMRVVRQTGFVFLIVPSSGPIHRYPVDCYRFYPDALIALAKYSKCNLVESWQDERGPWRDLVGVFRRSDEPVPVRAGFGGAIAPDTARWNGVPGTAEEELKCGRVSYLDFLERLHLEFTPNHYLEIGVNRGASLRLARGTATGVDPAPALELPVLPTTRLVSLASDDFFATSPDLIAPDFCFIDGCHLFEHALRDFMNIERRAAPGAVVVVDDILPNHPAQAERERRTQVWTGDVWRLVEILRRYRPDLILRTFDTAPTGLLVVAGLDPANRVLWDSYNSIVREARAFIGPPLEVLERREAIDPNGLEAERLIGTLKKARQERIGSAALRRMVHSGGKFDAPAVLAEPPALSIVVVAYDMARELPRTIRSLSPLMQRGIDARNYEVIVMDNGSPQPVDQESLRRILPNLEVYRLPDAPVSPVPAINRGLSMARGDIAGVFIDGARIASPGLVGAALAASRLHPRTAVGTIAFHLGPELQIASMQHGYNQAVEDDLLAASGWEEDGYRLFAISSFAASSAGGWFQLPAESNAVFLKAQHWRDLGGWDEGFATPGGGLANLDMWERICADSDTTVVMLLGEATFHQFHGGIATNNPDAPRALFHAEYTRVRGRPYRRPVRQPAFYGSLHIEAVASLRRSLGVGLQEA